MVCRCLDSLKLHIPHPLHCIIVDNSEPQDTELIALHHPETDIIIAGQNLGFGGGCNLGIAKAMARHSTYLLLLNPDTWAENDFLSPLIAALKGAHQVGVAGPQIIYGDGSRRIWNEGCRLNWWAGGTRAREQQKSKAEDKLPIDFLSGCALLLKGKAVQQVGLLAEDYFLYFEDTDYVQRFLKAGWSLTYVPEAVVLHEPSSITGMQSPMYVYFFSRNRIWFMRRWGKWYHLLFFMLYNTLVKLPGAIIIFGLQQRKPELAKAFIKGYWDGIKPYKISAK